MLSVRSGVRPAACRCDGLRPGLALRELLLTPLEAEVGHEASGFTRPAGHRVDHDAVGALEEFGREDVRGRPDAVPAFGEEH